MIKKGIMNADTILANPAILHLESFISEPERDHHCEPFKAITTLLSELPSAVVKLA